MGKHLDGDVIGEFIGLLTIRDRSLLDLIEFLFWMMIPIISYIFLILLNDYCDDYFGMREQKLENRYVKLHRGKKKSRFVYTGRFSR